MKQQSLVGMTMGARKRAARGSLLPDTLRASGSLKGWLRLPGPKSWNAEDWRSRYVEARALYRIGERLRPCKGCCACPGGREHDGPRGWIACGWRLLPPGFIDDHPAGQFHGEHCDGSGVLPARNGRR